MALFPWSRIQKKLSLQWRIRTSLIKRTARSPTRGHKSSRRLPPKAEEMDPEWRGLGRRWQLPENGWATLLFLHGVRAAVMKDRRSRRETEGTEIQQWHTVPRPETAVAIGKETTVVVFCKIRKMCVRTLWRSWSPPKPKRLLAV